MDEQIRRAARGDREAMASIVAEHYQAVFRFCARRVGPEIAPDASQETFITAQRQISRFEGNSTLQTWLFGIAHNHCRNLARKRKMDSIDWLNEAHGTENPEASIIDREQLRRALRKLTLEHREAVLLHEIDGLTYDEAAIVLGVPVGTVKSRLHHAFLHLRRSLQGSEEVTA